MNTTYRVLIVEDEPLAAEGYANVLNYLQTQNQNLYFHIDKAHSLAAAQAVLQHQPVANMIQNTFDLVFLDIRFPKDTFGSENSGIELGRMLRSVMPSAKVLIITNVDAPSILRNIMDDISPEAFLIKCDIDTMSLADAIEKVLRHERVTSKRIATFMRHQYRQGQLLNSLDIQLLQEIANGSKMKELMKLLPLTKSGIEKRRTQIKEKFGNRNMTDRQMTLLAKERGLI